MQNDGLVTASNESKPCLQSVSKSSLIWCYSEVFCSVSLVAFLTQCQPCDTIIVGLMLDHINLQTELTSNPLILKNNLQLCRVDQTLEFSDFLLLQLEAHHIHTYQKTAAQRNSPRSKRLREVNLNNCYALFLGHLPYLRQLKVCHTYHIHELPFAVAVSVFLS